MKTDIHFLPYLAEFFTEWESFQSKVAEKKKTQFMFNNVLRKQGRLWDNVEKYIVQPVMQQMTI